MLEDRGPIWETARTADAALARAGVPHALLGGLAVYLHGVRRATVDVDMLVEAHDEGRVRAALEDAGFRWMPRRREYLGVADTPIHLVLAGARIESTGITNPTPAGANVSRIEGLMVLRLARLIEIKLAVGLANERRTHKDLGDVLELIARLKLSKAFAARLHLTLRAEFKRLVDVARKPSKGRF